MIKITIKMLITCLILIGIQACGDNKSTLTSDDVVNHLKSQGYQGDASEVFYGMIGAIDGLQYVGDEFSIEVYKYKDASTLKAKCSICIASSGVWGIVIHEPQSSESQAKIIAAFKGIRK